MILFFVEIYFLIIQLETSMNSRSLEIFFTLCFCHANIARNAFRHVRLVRPSKLNRAMGRFSDVVWVHDVLGNSGTTLFSGLDSLEN